MSHYTPYDMRAAWARMVERHPSAFRDPELTGIDPRTDPEPPPPGGWPGADAVAASVAETLLPPPLPIFRDHVVELEGRTPYYLYRFAGEEFAYGDDVRKAELLTRAEADYRVAKLGPGWRWRRVP